MRSIGLDVGSRKIAYSEVVGGRVVARTVVESVDELEKHLGPGTPPATVAIEASGDAWHVHDTIADWGKTALLVDTTRVRALGIGHHGRKNDRIDAETLAFAVERHHIPQAHVLSPARRELRHYLHVRRALVETRTNLVLTLRTIFRSEGLRLPSCDAESFATMVRSKTLPRRVSDIVAPLLAALDAVQQQIVVADAQLVAVYEKEPDIQLLTTTPGVGLVVAAMFVAVIDEAKRFSNAHQVESYLGLVPRENSSGNTGRRLGSITKHGNTYLRSLLVQSAWQVLRRKDPDPLVLWAKAVAERRGKRVAMVAVARRLAGILWAMWKRRLPYDSHHLADAAARGLDDAAALTRRRAAALRAAKKKVTANVARAARAARRPTTTSTRSLAHPA